jgi:hypothetical protein
MASSLANEFVTGKRVTMADITAFCFIDFV